MKERLKNVPLEPGVYIYKDQQGEVIYVGKAKALRNRMRSYFQARDKLHPKVRAMMSRVHDFEFIVTATEVEALILENNLIKAYKPRYNIDLRDDKSYPYVKITTAEEYPRIFITREKKDKVSRYFGPYTDVTSLKETLKLLNLMFPLRTCRTFKSRPRACLNHDIGKCMAPCIGTVGAEEYQQMVKSVIAFMEGDTRDLIRNKEAEMKEASHQLEFEKAARIRDQIASIKKLSEKQIINLEKPYNLDLIALVKDQQAALVLLFKIRSGRLIDRDMVWLNQAMNEDLEQLIEYFLQYYYHHKDQDIPGEILLNILPANLELMEGWLRKLSGRRVKLSIPLRGDRRSLMNMAVDNTELLFKERMEREQVSMDILVHLSRVLKLEEVPERMECYDISHLAGQAAVASMVVFSGGAADKKAYRHFKISRDQNDDFASLAETLVRRFQQAQQGNPAFLPEPGLVLIDGGLGQVNAVHKVLEEIGVDVPLFSLAKKEELIFWPHAPEPIRLSRRDEGLKLLQRMRDEAHRFAIEYNRKLRQKKTRKSSLDEIPGIGEKRKMLLLGHFGSVARVAQATLEELQNVPGLPAGIAATIYDYYHGHKK